MFAKVSHVVNLKVKKKQKKNRLQASLLTKKASIRLFLFLMKVAFEVPCWFHEWRIYQNVPHVYVSRQATFSGPRKRLLHNII